MSKKKVSTTYNLDVHPSNIGAFIGPKGSNFKKMIAEMKKQILKKSSEITPEEWSSVNIILKFDKPSTSTSDGEETDERDYDFIHAVYECKKKHEPIVQKVLDEFVILHKKENELYQKRKLKGKRLIYRIGAEHRFIGRMIGVGGSNVGELKTILKTLPMMETISSITIEEQTKRFDGDFRNIGDRECDEHIMMFISLKGTPDFDQVQSVVEDFIKKHTIDEPRNLSNESDSDEDEDDEDEDETEFDGKGW